MTLELHLSLKCDETTDVAVVIVYNCYLGRGRKVYTSFIVMVEVADGTAKNVLAALDQLCNQEQKMLTSL